MKTFFSFYLLIRFCIGASAVNPDHVAVTKHTSPCRGYDQFRCQSGGLPHQCLEKHWICDNNPDCVNGEDEDAEFCENYHVRTECTDGEFECADHQCLPVSHLCDHAPDCTGGEDEQNCDLKHNCSKGQFECRVSGMCLSLIFLCDGKDDCGDSSDEEYCNCTPESSFRCADGKRCPNTTSVCDGRLDCPDSSDEGARCSDEECSLLCVNGECFKTPSGPACLCPTGLKEQRGICTDINECEGAVCDHYCINGIGTYTCTCKQGYALHGKEICKASGDATATLIYSSRNDVRALNLKSKNEFEVYSGGVLVIAVAYDPVDHKVYWSDYKGTIQRRSLTGHGPTEVVVDKDLGFVRTIAVDWKGRNIYLADETNNRTVVCNLENLSCKKLFDEPTYPTSVQLDLAERQMYWTDGEESRIYRANMDGSEKMILEQENMTWPNALCLDAPARKLYWMDAKLNLLEQFDLGQSTRKIISGVEMNHPFSMAVWEDKLYWSDWKNEEIVSVHKTDGSNRTVLFNHNLQFNGLTIYHEQMEIDARPEDNPCKGAGCSHICLLKKLRGNGPSFTCACPEEMSLAGNFLNCIEDETLQSIAVASESTIYEIKPRMFSRPEIIKMSEGFEGISDMEYDPIKKTVFIGDRKAGVIKKIELKDRKTTTIITGLRRISGIAVDWTRGNIYWVDSFFKNLEVATVDGHYRTKLDLGMVCMTLDVVVHPGTGQVILACESHPGRIISCTRSGGPCAVLAERKIMSPGALTLDRRNVAAGVQSNWVYWTDSFYSRIERVSLDGKLREVFYAHNPAGIQISAGTIYLTAVGDFNTVYKTKNLTSDEIKWEKITIDSHTRNLRRFRKDHMAIADIRWPLLNPSVGRNSEICITAGCQQLCLEDQYKQPVCACSSSHQLLDDGKNCEHKECEVEMFKCLTENKCIPKSFTCNQIIDCEDRSDESASTCMKCTEDSFHCRSNGECFELDRECDGVQNCRDNSDEENCATPACMNGFSECADGECYLNVTFCDGVKDCNDSSDESDCPSCSLNQFKCLDGIGRCVPISTTCDGINDCDDGSDELNCPVTCNYNEFLCVSNQTCLSRSKVCDTIQDCLAGEDELEEDCTKPITLCTLGSRGCTVSCKEWEFRCSSGLQCIQEEFHCDGESHCDDQSDELNCPIIISPNDHSRRPCGRGMFDCGDGECIHGSRMCDDIIDCPNTADEDKFCNQTCVNNGGCQHKCRSGLQPWHCFCNRGYKLKEDGRNCEDSNECEQSDPCEQICHNTPGSFTCSCTAGYTRANDHISCQAKSGRKLVMALTSGKNIQYLGGRANASGSTGIPSSTVLTEISFDDVEQKFISLSDDGSLGAIDPRTLRWSPYFGSLKNPTISIDSPGQNVYIGQNLDSEPISVSSLMVCSLRTVVCFKIYEEANTIISAIRVAETERKLFYCVNGVSSDYQPKIIHSMLDGSQKITLVNPKMKLCSHLALDEPKKTLYWVDPLMKRINRATWSGHAMSSYKSLEVMPLSLDVSGFWIQWLLPNKSIQRCHKHNSKHCSPVGLRNSATALSIISGVYGSESAICRANSCSNICLTVADKELCACDDPSASGCSVPKAISSLSRCDPVICEPGGVCVPINQSDYSCRCSAGYSGPTCSHKETSDHVASFVKPLVWSVMILVFAAVFAGLYYYYKRPLFIFKRNRKSGKAQVRFANPAFGAPKDEIDATQHTSQFVSSTTNSVTPLQPSDPHSLVSVQIHGDDRGLSDELLAPIAEPDRSRGLNTLV